EDVVHVGDSLVADVQGASRLGMRTVWVNRGGLHRGPADPAPDAEAHDLRELPAILERLFRDRCADAVTRGGREEIPKHDGRPTRLSNNPSISALAGRRHCRVT